MIRDHREGVPSRGLLLGTCATLAGRSNLPAPVLRVAGIVAMCLWFKLTVLLYCGSALYYRLQR